MDTCEYCEADITIAAEVVLGPDGPERRGCCEGCGHVVSVCATATATATTASAASAATTGAGRAGTRLPLAS